MNWKRFVSTAIIIIQILSINLVYAKEDNRNVIDSQEFWLNRISDKEKVILDNDEITLFNQKMFQLPQTKVCNLKKYPSTILKKDLINFINEMPIPKEDRYIGNEKANNYYYESIIKNMVLNKIKEINQIKYGLITKRADIRTLPTNDPSYSEPNDTDFDNFQESTLEVAEPVLIMNNTLDNNWSFIQAYNYRGWVTTKNIAITKNRNMWLNYLEERNFIVIIANHLSIDLNMPDKENSIIIMGMGSKLPLSNDKIKPKYINGFSTSDKYIAKLPVRDKHGNLEFRDILVPQGDDVNYGYLKYCPANIVKLAFKMLGDQYGWSGSVNNRDCSAFICDIFKCFGFLLPRNTDQQEFSPGYTVNLQNKSLAERTKILEALAIGSLLFMKNHIMLYLGQIDSKSYVIHDLYAYYDKNKLDVNGNPTMIVNKSVAITDLEIVRSTKESFLESLTIVKTIN